MFQTSAILYTLSKVTTLKFHVLFFRVDPFCFHTGMHAQIDLLKVNNFSAGFVGDGEIHFSHLYASEILPRMKYIFAHAVNRLYDFLVKH